MGTDIRNVQHYYNNTGSKNQHVGGERWTLDPADRRARWPVQFGMPVDDWPLDSTRIVYNGHISKPTVMD